MARLDSHPPSYPGAPTYLTRTPNLPLPPTPHVPFPCRTTPAWAGRCPWTPWPASHASTGSHSCTAPSTGQVGLTHGVGPPGNAPSVWRVPHIQAHQLSLTHFFSHALRFRSARYALARLDAPARAGIQAPQPFFIFLLLRLLTAQVHLCPACKRVQAEAIEVEYARSQDAWRIGKFFVVLCIGCRRN